ncbi:MAG: BMP family ABC transporter substrate-binding protein [Atopobiaceae bacterium]|nr:BMP family ABC transporter substrate-binding protein [Atopobiaceae bacterium]
MIEDYRKARKRGAKQVKKAVSAGQYPFPPALDELLQSQPLARKTNIGTCEIPVDLVVGTRVRGRQNLFSADFMPLANEDTEFAAKWSALHDAQISEGIHDPVVVYEYLQRFYVQEGNKRVSVARYVGMPAIRAEVTRVVPTWGAGLDDELERYEAFERFYAAVPLYDLAFSNANDYELLSQALNKSLNAPWASDDVRHLKAAFSAFCAEYARRGGDRLECSASDAFLLYVQAYEHKDPLDSSAVLMSERIKPLWREFVMSSQSEPAEFMAEPQEKAAAAQIVSKVVDKVRPRRAFSRVAFVYDRDVTTSGWTRLHDEARQTLASRMHDALEALVYEGCGTDELFDKAVASAVDAGCSVVVTISPRQLAQARRASLAYPRVQFLNCSVNQSSPAVRTFYARMYEVKFLMGVLAASLSQSHQLGYVAHAPMGGAVAEVNAFALGAALVDPYATVYLRWSTAAPLGSGDDGSGGDGPGGGVPGGDEFANVGVDVIADKDYASPTAPDKPFGLYAVHDGGWEHVATPVWDWGRYYELMLRSLCAAPFAARTKGGGAQRFANYWWGMRTGVVRLDLEEGVALGQQRLVHMLEAAMVEGRLAPFDTVLVDQSGNLVRRADEPQLSDERIADMRWLSSNVVGTLPQLSELTPAGQADVCSGASGLRKSAGTPVADKPGQGGK